MLTTIAAMAVLAGEPTALELTVYNQGMALVKESRSLELLAGRQEVALPGVAAQIDPTSVSFGQTSGEPFRLLEQNYRFDLVSAMAILQKSVGQTVRFLNVINGQLVVTEGELLSPPTGVSADGLTFVGAVIRETSGAIILNPTGQLRVEKLPDGLISRPSLIWDIESAKAGTANVDLRYITNGLRWNAAYVLTLDGKGKGDLQGWVTLDNQSGTSFKNAKLKLLAGDVNRATPPGAMGGAERAAVKMVLADAAVTSEQLFEYHLYTVSRPTTVADKEIKQVSLLEGGDIPVVKRLIFDAIGPGGVGMPQEGEMDMGTVSALVKVEFKNDKASNLGMPLPAGRFRLYQRDASGSTQLLGEDRINHTPRDERVSLNVGRAFDVVGTRKRTEFRRLNDRTVRESFEVSIRNRKETEEKVEVLERFWGDWKITASNLPSSKVEALTAKFEVTLKPGEERVVRYTVETRW